MLNSTNTHCDPTHISLLYLLFSFGMFQAANVFHVLFSLFVTYVVVFASMW